jgi:hypothetical protein
VIHDHSLQIQVFQQPRLQDFLKHLGQHRQHRDGPIIGELRWVFTLEHQGDSSHLEEGRVMTPPDSTIKQTGQGAQNLTGHSLDDPRRNLIIT